MSTPPAQHPDESLAHLRSGTASAGAPLPPATGRISVVIPTLNEQDYLQATIERALDAADVEIIVVDGGSDDATVRIARELTARVVEGATGRGAQMNAGAAAATGELLLFLHADTLLPANYDAQVRHVLSRPEVAAGAFRLRIDSSRLALRCVAWGANLRSRWGAMPYGDQALFMRAATFHALGGYRDWPIMEDFDLTRRLRRHGRIYVTDAVATTSARRWQRYGVVRTTLIHQLCAAGFLLGISPQRLARWRRDRMDTRVLGSPSGRADCG